MVVLFQYAISKRSRPYPPLLVMAAGGLLYAAGFSMYGYTQIYPLFMLAMAIITLGEMVQAPVSTSWVSTRSPEDMRGRYMAIYGLSWLFPETLGVTLGGLVMDNYDPRLLWYFAGALALLSAFGYIWLHRRLQKQSASQII
jgi:MFS family permease